MHILKLGQLGKDGRADPSITKADFSGNCCVCIVVNITLCTLLSFLWKDKGTCVVLPLA